MPLGILLCQHGFYLFSNVKVEKIEDFKGLKFRSNAFYEPFQKKLGIVRVSIPGSEMYTAMERGLVQGFPYPRFITRLSMQEVTKYRINHPWWNGDSNWHYINQKTYESLPEEWQKILMDAAKEVEQKIQEVKATFDLKEDKAQLDAGMKFIKLTPPDDKRLLEIIQEATWETLSEEAPDAVPTLKKMLAK